MAVVHGLLNAVFCLSRSGRLFDSPHLVCLVGLVTQNDAYAIMEFMPHGDLKHYLRDIRPEVRPSFSLCHVPVSICC